MAYPVGTALLFLVAWQLSVTVFDVPNYVLATPTAIVAELVAERRELWHHALATLLAVISGFGLAIAVSQLVRPLRDGAVLGTAQENGWRPRQ